MKKLFNNSTKGNDTQNESSKSKRKFLKTFSFTSLALLMGIAGTMAFAPIGTTTTPIANASEISTESGGLITPKKDDPVIYTTESGLKIYAGKATVINKIPTPFGSGFGNPNTNLKTFPYLVTLNGSTVYYWTIIGQSNSGPVFTYANDPASKAISAEVIASIKSNTEIPSGCILVLANNIVGSTAYSTNYGRGDLSTRYSLESLGLSSLNIQTTSITRREWDGTNYSVSAKLFSLGGVTASFKYTNYLTTDQFKISSNVWTGDSYSGYVAGYITTSGGFSTTGGTCGDRPAFVLKIT